MQHPGSPAPSPNGLMAYRSWRFHLVMGFWALLAAICLLGAVSWVDRPFPGFLLEHNMSVALGSETHWSGMQAEVPAMSRLVAVDGVAVHTHQEVLDRVRAHPVGTPFSYRLATPTGTVDYHVPSSRFTWSDFAHHVLPSWLGGATLLAVGAVVLYLRPEDPAARAHWCFCQAIGLIMVGNFESASTSYFGKAWVFGFILAVPAIVALAAIFPRPVSPRLQTRLLAVAWSLAAVGTVLHLVAVDSPALWPIAVQVLMGLPALAMLGFIAHCAWAACARKLPAQVRSQAATVVAGLCLAFLPALVWTLATAMRWELPLDSSLAFAPLALFPASLGVAIAQHQLFGLQPILRRFLLYVGTLGTLAALYLGVVTAAFALSHVEGRGTWQGLVAALVVAAAFQPVYRGLRRTLERLFLKERADAVGLLSHFADQGPRDSLQLGHELVALVGRAMRPGWIQLRLGDAVVAEAGRPPSGAPRGEVLGLVPLAAAWPEAEGHGLAIGLATGTGAMGALFLGPRANGLPYDGEDMAVLRVLAHQAAIAFHNARLFEEQVALSVREALASRLAEERRMLLSQVVHDIRTDLFNIQAATAVIDDQGDAREPLESILRSVRRIDDLLGEKTRWARSERPTSACRLEPVLDDAAQVMHGHLTRREQRLLLARPAAEVEVPLTEIELLQILLNLLSNASKFAPPCTEVRLLAEVGVAEVVVAVEDEGPGLPPSLLHDPTTGQRGDPGVPGDGLGLQNVKGLVERAGGRLAWANTGTGARFEVHLPRVGA